MLDPGQGIRRDPNLEPQRREPAVPYTPQPPAQPKRPLVSISQINTPPPLGEQKLNSLAGESETRRRL